MKNLTRKNNVVKIVKPKILCHKHKNGKKYYCIKYFDIFTGEYCIGYGSYCKKFVKEWLRNDFVTVPKIDLEMHGCMKQEVSE